MEDITGVRVGIGGPAEDEDWWRVYLDIYTLGAAEQVHSWLVKTFEYEKDARSFAHTLKQMIDG
jgi:hypothetical protein